MSLGQDNQVVIPDLVNREERMLLRALQVHGGMLSIENAATYLRKSEEEVLATAKELHAWKLARNYAYEPLGAEILKITQYGELAILEASGLDFDGYEQLKQRWVEDWVYWYENYRD